MMIIWKSQIWSEQSHFTDVVSQLTIRPFELDYLAPFTDVGLRVRWVPTADSRRQLWTVWFNHPEQSKSYHELLRLRSSIVRISPWSRGSRSPGAMVFTTSPTEDRPRNPRRGFLITFQARPSEGIWGACCCLNMVVSFQEWKVVCITDDIADGCLSQPLDADGDLGSCVVNYS